jgi:alkanesulfonate monooxygenase SsuD/methylene tetrahydromethanopterin reductase-like flavin-dependent oxidoreductase (luciferase family)
LSFLKNSGIMLEPQEGMSTAELLRLASQVEKLGFGYFFRSDHLLPIFGALDKESPECWVTLGAIAAETKNLKFGPLVSPVGFRNPALLARMASTVNSISRGRLQLGLGAGWYRSEYLAHGFDFPSIKTRREQFLEALEIIRAYTQSGRVSYKGRFFSAELKETPKPEYKTHIIVGGLSRYVARAAVRFADEWNTYLHPASQAPELLKELESSTRRVTKSVMLPFLIGEDEEDVMLRLRRRRQTSGESDAKDGQQLETLRAQGWLIAPEDEFPSLVRELTSRGVDRIYFQLLDTQDTKSLELLAEVLARMKPEA